MCRWREPRRVLLIAVILVAAHATAAERAGTFGFGRVPGAEEVAAWDIDVRPDGRGLPAGRGTVAEGQAIYDARCASCHGTFGESNDYMALAGGVGSLATAQPVRTTGSKLNYATTLFDYIRRAMPFGEPKSLRDDEVYALTAYVLHLNDILPFDAVLDRERLPRVRLPNRDGFTREHGFGHVRGRPDTRNVACMRNCAGEVRVSSEMPDHARDSHGNLADQGRAFGVVVGATTSTSPEKLASGEDLARRAACMACHGITSRVVGPAFRDVASRYAGDGAAEARMLARIRAGGSGAWGDTPMPAQPQLDDRDARVIVQWILGGAR